MPGTDGPHAPVMTASTTLTAPAPSRAPTVVAPGPPAPGPPAPRVRLRRIRYEPEPGTPPRTGTGPDRREQGSPAPDEPTVVDLETTRRALSGSLRVAMEVLDGRRPAAQLVHHFEDRPLRYWRAAAHRRQVRAPARVVRMRLCLPRTGAAEVAAVCDIDGRVRALAARYERPGSGHPWRCTALRLG